VPRVELLFATQLLHSPLHEDIAWFLSRLSEGSFDVIGHGERHAYKRPGLVHRMFHWVVEDPEVRFAVARKTIDNIVPTLAKLVGIC